MNSVCPKCGGRYTTERAPLYDYEGSWVRDHEPVKCMTCGHIDDYKVFSDEFKNSFAGGGKV